MSVTDILERLAENAGRKQLARGQLIGGAIADASLVPGQILNDRERTRQVQLQEARQAEQLGFQRHTDQRAGADQARQDAAATAAATKAQQAEQERQDRGAIIAAGLDPASPTKWHFEPAVAKAMSLNRPEVAHELIDAHDKATRTNAPKTQAELAADAANPDSPTQKQSTTALDLMRPPKPEPTPKGYQHVDKLLDGKPATLLIDPTPGGKTYDLSGAPIENAATRVRPIPAASIQIHNDNAKVPTLPAWALDDTRPSGPDANKLDATVRMTPNGLFQAAQTYIATGQFPPTARGSDAIAQNTRAAITSKVGAIAASSGLDEPALRSFYKSNAASLAQQQKMQDSVQGFMATADKNAALLQETLKTIPDTGIPIFNQPVRAFAKNVAGNKNLAQFATYLQSVQNEYARIISQPNLAGQLTDSARHEAEALLDPKATVPQILGSIEALQKEGNNRLVSVGEQIQRIQKRMQVTPSAAPAPGAPIKVGGFTVVVK